MRFIFIFISFCCFCISVRAAIAQSDIKPEIFGALPEIADASVSPDGKTIALLENFADDAVLRFFDVRTGQLHNGLKIGALKARDIRWANNEQVLLLVSRTEKINTGSALKDYEIWRYAAISKDLKITYLLAKGAAKNYTGSGTILHMLPDDPDHILMTHSNATIFKVNLKSGYGKKYKAGLSTNDVTAIGWLFDQAGDPVIRIDYNSDKKIKTILQKKKGKTSYKKIVDLPTGGDDEIFFHNLADHQRAYVSTRAGSNTLGVYYYDLEKVELDAPIFHNKKYDYSNFSIRNGKITAIRYVDDTTRTIYFDDEQKILANKLAKAIPNATINIFSSADDNSVIVLYASYTNKPPEYFLYEAKSRSLSILGSTYTALDETNSGLRQKYSYKTNDGYSIDGYLTIPAGTTSPKSMPLIVLPHGGPEARDTLDFDWWSAAYASKGYLVYQPNFRGSSGYGLSFTKAGWRQWGRKMQDDITEGVQKLIADGKADPDRICIVGASYGGYAALAGATLTPSLYRCAVSINGRSPVKVSNSNF